MPSGVYDHKERTPREVRTCLNPECDITFKVLTTSKKKYCSRVCANRISSKNEESNTKRRKAQTGRKHSEETIRKMKGKPAWNVGLTKETDLRVAGAAEKMRGEKNPNFGKRPSEETIEKLRKARQGKSHSEETKRKISETETGKEVLLETRRKIAKLWENPEYVKQVRGKNRPSVPEKQLDFILQKLFPNQWKHVGSGDFTVEGTNKNPDFVHVIQKKIIEMNGDYWHGPEITGRTKEEEEQQRIDLFAQHGYQTLIVWECELKDIRKLEKRLLDFHGDIL